MYRPQEIIKICIHSNLIIRFHFSDEEEKKKPIKSDLILTRALINMKLVVKYQCYVEFMRKLHQKCDT